MISFSLLYMAAPWQAVCVRQNIYVLTLRFSLTQQREEHARETRECDVQSREFFRLSVRGVWLTAQGAGSSLAHPYLSSEVGFITLSLLDYISLQDAGFHVCRVDL